MSMPTVVSSTLSAAHATSLTRLIGGADVEMLEFEIVHDPGGMAEVARLAQAASLTNFAMPDFTPYFASSDRIDLVDARILVLVLDLAAAVLDAHVHAHEHVALIGGERDSAGCRRRPRDSARDRAPVLKCWWNIWSGGAKTTPCCQSTRSKSFSPSYQSSE